MNILSPHYERSVTSPCISGNYQHSSPNFQIEIKRFFIPRSMYISTNLILVSAFVRMTACCSFPLICSTKIFFSSTRLVGLYMFTPTMKNWIFNQYDCKCVVNLTYHLLQFRSGYFLKYIT